MELLEVRKEKSGCGEGKGKKVGEISWEEVGRIGEEKMVELKCLSVEGGMKMVGGRGGSMGMGVKGELGVNK